MVANYTSNRSTLYLLNSFLAFNILLYDTMPVGYFIYIALITLSQLISRHRFLTGLYIFSTIPLAIYLTGQFRSVECATFILGTLCVLKAFEVKKLRDLFSYYVMYILFMAGSILLTTEVIAIVLVIYSLGSMFFNLGKITRVTYERGRLTMMLLTSVLFVSILYLLIPQVGMGGAFSFASSRAGSTGVSEELKPGTISDLVLDKSVHYIIEMNSFPKSFYWRAYTFNRTDGKRWWGRTNYKESIKTRQDSYDFKVNKIGRKNLPVIKNKDMDIFVAADSVSVKENEYGDIKIPKAISNYFLQSGKMRSTVSDEERKFKTRLSPKLIKDLDRFKGLSVDETVLALINFFKSLKLEYSLSGADFDTNDISGFLYTTKKGYCEHFASAFALALNHLGIQSHVLVGYYGGEYNKSNNFLVLKGENAHAWIEYYDGTQWVDFDPVEFIVSKTSLPPNEMAEVKARELFSSNDLSFSLDDFLYGSYLKLNYLFFSFDLEQQKELYQRFRIWADEFSNKNLRFYKLLTFFLSFFPILLIATFFGLSDSLTFRLLKWRERKLGQYNIMESFLPIYQCNEQLKRDFLELYLKKNYSESTRLDLIKYQFLKWRVLLKI
ncbi:DUF3488 and transglutaminase-like domain-containing protein [Bacteriovorax sp. Seq25_V]|uniref:DUF3488 and transglutaminase-like domain-containing protein n=1 Tax=Bacteriovorax sp. Seq25_V TaxID=1201288 RepID=UPI000389F599|nr:DUF3488 and transglutaminase-like domain-containing protein [Bacteriovorax sp. Seq25_V]EQC43669.1 PF11992 domain protein [Bacteriovorax sp. Seq25_V]